MIPTKNLLVLKKTVFVLALGWTILMAFLCLISFSKLPNIGLSGTDKYVHFMMHFIFTLFWSSYVSIRENVISIPKIVRIVLISFCYGILIELLQEAYTSTRHADVFDVLANFSGALFSLLFFVIIKKKDTIK